MARFQRVIARALVGVLAGIVLVLGIASTAFAVAPSGGYGVSLPPAPQSTSTTFPANISCASSTFCVGVGVGSQPIGGSSDQSAIFMYNGSTWTATDFAPSDYFSAVSCASSTFCVAVGGMNTGVVPNGEPIAETWNGSAWSASTIPLPPVWASYANASEIGALSPGIQCFASSSCITVIAQEQSEYSNQTVDAMTSVLSGSTWTTSQLDVPSGDSIYPAYGLSSPFVYNTPPSYLSCMSVTACTLVGASANSSGQMFLDTLSGTTWAPSVIQTNALSVPYGISCTSSTSCVVVDVQKTYSTTNGYQHVPYIWTESNGAWTSIPAPVPTPIKSGILDGISCTSSTSCVAVGYYTPSGSYNMVPIADTLSGTAWTSSIQPSVGTTFQEYGDSISCTSSTNCVSLGAAQSFNGSATYPFASVYDGSTWTPQTVPMPTATSLPVSQNNSPTVPVQCPTATFCVGVLATAQNGQGVMPGVVMETWDGSTWTTQILQLQVASNFDMPGRVTPSGLSCPSTTTCYLSLNDNGTAEYVAALTATGSTWSVAQLLPIPVTGYNGLLGISCASSTACVALGETATYTIRSGSGTITTSPLPTPAGITPSNIGSISCASSTSCVAVLQGYNSSGSVSIIATYDGSTWSVTSTPTANGSQSLNNVSCGTPTFCIAATTGQNYGYVYNTPAPIQIYNGTAWSTSSISFPAFAAANNSGALLDISCESSTLCAAIGFSGSGSNNSGHQFSVETWNGTAWTASQLPNQSADGGHNFAGISCPTATFCAVVGASSSYNQGIEFGATYDGSTWTTSPLNTVPGEQINTMSSLSCPIITACFGIALPSNTSLDGATPDIYSLDGASWSVVPVPALPLSDGTGGEPIQALSCVSSTFCVGVGFAKMYDPSTLSSSSSPTIATYDGSTWTYTTPPPLPSGYTSGDLLGISCASITSCVAVGTAHTATSSTREPLAETWDGSTWSASITPLPSAMANGGILDQVSCASSTSCVALGRQSLNNSTGASPWTAAFDGTVWTSSMYAIATGYTSTTLTGIACVSSAVSCEIVGNASSSSNANVEHPFADQVALPSSTTSSSNARVVAPITPTASFVPVTTGSSATVSSISCASSTVCVVVGTITSQGSSTTTRSPLAMTLTDGTTWSASNIGATILPTATAAPSSTSGFSVVSCPSARACMALGTDSGGSYTPYALAILDLSAGFGITPPASTIVPAGQTASFTLTPWLETYPDATTPSFVWGYYGTSANGAAVGTSQAPISLGTTSVLCDSACANATSPISYPSANEIAPLPPGTWTVELTTLDAPRPAIVTTQSVTVTQAAQVANAVPTSCKPTVTITSGQTQSTQINTQFPQTIELSASSSCNGTVAGLPVSVTFPTAGPSASYPSGAPSVTVSTAGTVTIPAPVANGIPGAYTATVSVGPATTTLALDNTATPSIATSASPSSPGLIDTGSGASSPQTPGSPILLIILICLGVALLAYVFRRHEKVLLVMALVLGLSAAGVWLSHSTPRSTHRVIAAPAVPSRSVSVSASSTPSVPVQLLIPSLQINATVVPTVDVISDGVKQLVIPADVHHVGWWSASALPGDPGTTLLAGHINWIGQGPGALANLDQIQVGASVVTRSANGSSTDWTTSQVQVLPKAQVAQMVWPNTGPPQLVVITCGGPYDATTHQYADNVVATEHLSTQSI